jgi:CheY-like chemotaxis protein
MDIYPDLVALPDVERYVTNTFAAQAEQQRLELIVKSQPDLPDTIETDSQRLHQVLKNLLSNALKFTPTGAVSLEIRRPTQEELAGLPESYRPDEVVTFSVTDTGIGIPPEKLKEIFEAFQQGDGRTSRKYGGTGLGLSISREIARLLGCSIAVSSVVGSGSAFALSVPVSYAGVRDDLIGDDSRVAQRFDAKSISLERIPVLSATSIAVPDGFRDDPLAGAVVLIVDDDVRNVFALTSALELHGMTVLYADNGQEGLRLLDEHRDVELVLMDIMMPDMDGRETTAHIRAMNGCADLPVIFLTAKAMPDDRDKALAAGASDYITKPVDLDRLLGVMRSWLGKRPNVGSD